jgi:hypothetical protein
MTAYSTQIPLAVRCVNYASQQLAKEDKKKQHFIQRNAKSM